MHNVGVWGRRRWGEGGHDRTTFVCIGFHNMKCIENGGGHDRTIFVWIGFHDMKCIENGRGRERTPTGWPCWLSNDYWIVACIILIRVLGYESDISGCGLRLRLPAAVAERNLWPPKQAS